MKRALLIAAALLVALPVRAQSTNEERFRSLPPEKQEELRQQLQRVLDADPAERRQILDNMKRWQQMTPEQRQQLRQRFRDRRQQRKQERQQDRKERREERRLERRHG